MENLINAKTYLNFLFLSFILFYCQLSFCESLAPPCSFDPAIMIFEQEDCDTMVLITGNKALVKIIDINKTEVTFTICGNEKEQTRQISTDRILLIKFQDGREWKPELESKNWKSSESTAMGRAYNSRKKSVQPKRSDASPNIFYGSYFIYPQSWEYPGDHYIESSGISVNLDRSFTSFSEKTDLGVSARLGSVSKYLLMGVGPQLFVGPNTSCWSFNIQYTLLVGSGSGIIDQGVNFGAGYIIKGNAGFFVYPSINYYIRARKRKANYDLSIFEPAIGIGYVF